MDELSEWVLVDNPHEILGVPPDADLETILQAFKTTVHDELGQFNVERYMQLSAALEVLLDEDAKRNSQNPEQADTEPVFGMKEIGRSVKHYSSRAPQNVQKAYLAVVNAHRSHSSASFLRSIERTWGPRELEVLRDPPRHSCTRLVTIRHGMGYHNDAYGTASIANRDAELNQVGEAEARILGMMLNDAGYFNSNDLFIVVSPFTRALQTLLGIMGKESWDFPTIVHPLCAEHTLKRSVLQQGDRGSTRADLEKKFPPSVYSSFDFSTLDTYCQLVGAEVGAWWHHGPANHEEFTNFEMRAQNFRVWLGEECKQRQTENVLVVSHGGLLTTAFDPVGYQNCEFRVFDLCTDGDFHRCGRPPPEPTILMIHSVTDLRDKTYEIRGRIYGQNFAAVYRLSEVRAQLHKCVRDFLSEVEYNANFNTSFPGARIYWANMKPWLVQLSVAIEISYTFTDIEKVTILSFFIKKRTDNPAQISGNGKTQTLFINGVTSRNDGFYRITGSLRGKPFTILSKLSEAREKLHAEVTKSLSQCEYRRLFPTSFPGSSFKWTLLEPWLSSMANAINDNTFEEDLQRRLLIFFETELTS